MATIPNPPTFTVGQKLTAALMNTNVRDAVNFLVASPLCVCTNTAGQSITNNTLTALTFDTESTDIDGMHSTVTNTSRLTAVTAGWYYLSASVAFAFNATGQRGFFFRLNGTTYAGFTQVQATSAAETAMATSAAVFLNASDYAEVIVNQNSGIAVSTSVATALTRISALWMHS